jgi:exodeoxyribonuclease VIII
MTDITEVLTHEPDDEYHSKAGEYLSSHQLADFRASPELYRHKQLGVIDPPDSNDLAFGKALHCHVLEGVLAFRARYAIGGPTNPTTGCPYKKNTKAFSEWAESHGKPGIHYDELKLLINMHSRVVGHSIANELLAEGMAEGVLRANYCGEPCQIRIDWANPERDAIVDLKTTADLDRFEYDATKYRYAHQMAFYHAILAQAIGRNVSAYLIAIEKQPRHRCGVWLVTANKLAVARRENEAAIQRLQQCRAKDHWPTGYEDLRVL